MNEKYLVAVDGSEHGWKALDLAAKLAGASDAELILLHVVPHEPMPDGLAQFAKAEGLSMAEERGRYHEGRRIGDQIVRQAEARVRKSGFERVSSRVEEGSPADRIVAVAEGDGTDMIFLGSRGLSDLKGLLMGSVSHKLMHLAPCTCVVVK
ncbi:MAG: universal stress protein [Alphaproteobacteria bacterium]|jgi:nucleotide-binding universal stress UspA family protein|nr:universal stress protein [Alphaproteobacteria bacterium]MDP6832917.1 universal stress protein [Alphaproteobacteria bacterium]